MNIERLGAPIRRFLQSRGYDLVKFRSLNTILSHYGVTVVFDVGANVGQYGGKLRKLGYRGKIVSFEPQSQPYGVLSAAAREDGNWTACHLGLGSEKGEKTINVYSDSCLSSMLTLDQSQYFMPSEVTGTETIAVETFDNVFAEHVQPADNVFLKIDTQGLEREVLRGAEQSLQKVAGIQIEMSLTPIYAGQPHLDEMIALLRGHGFILWQIQRGICELTTGQEFEVDGIFIREAVVKK